MCRRVNSGYAHVCVNWNIRPAETIPKVEGVGGKGEWWGLWIQLWYIVRPFVNLQQWQKITK
jgi:hypothetical protein